MISSEPEADSLRAAGIITRGSAAVIDLLVVLLIMSALYGGLVLVRLIYSPAAFSLPSLSAVFSTVVTFAVAVLYLTGCWRVSGSTAGAVTMGLRVVGRRSQRVTLSVAISACGRLRDLPGRLAMGHRRSETKIAARHRLSHESGLLAAVGRRVMPARSGEHELEPVVPAAGQSNQGVRRLRQRRVVGDDVLGDVLAVGGQ